MRHSARILCASGLLALSTSVTAQAPAPVPQIQAVATVPTAKGGSNRAVVVKGPEGALVVGSAELNGLELYDLGGKRIGAFGEGEIVSADIRYGALGPAGPATVLVAADSSANTLRFFRSDAGSLTEVGARPVPLGFAVEGVCLYHSAQDGTLYAFAVGDGGEVDQYMVFAVGDGKVDARQVRRLHLASPAEHCVADDDAAQLYISEQAVGIWRFNAEPETDVAPALVDAARLGRITEEVGGLALYDGGDGARWLIASNASAGQLYVYDRSKDDAFVGAVTVASGGAAVSEPGGLYATSAALPGYPSGSLLIADDDAEGGSNYKIVGFDKLADALNVSAGTPQPAVTKVAPTFPTVRPVVETAPVAKAGDAADDPAIWANAADPARSLIIGTDKQGGLHVYDMQGRSLQFVADGKMNNVDLREGFKLGGRSTVLVTASDRTNKAVAIYALDTANSRLVPVADGIQATGLSDPYGQCMFVSPRTGRYYVFVSDPDGLVRQWRLVATNSGKVRMKPVRDLKFSSQTEGCVADDRSGTLFVGEEDVGLWRVTAEPVARAVPLPVDTVKANAKLKDDIEGVGIYHLGGGRGYVIASSQGNNSYAVYRLEGDGAYLGSFSIIADAARGIDGVSETDGLEVSSADLGPGFEKGAMVAQDGRNVLPVENQNFKMVSWQSIASALGLEVRP